MPHALLRQALADLRSRRIQSAQLLLLIAVAAFTATLAVGVQRDGSARWDGLFEASNASHVSWILRDTRVDVSPIVQMEGVAQAAGPYPVVRDLALAQDSIKTNLMLVAVEGEPPRVERPLLVAGGWLAAGRDDQVVIDATFARELRLRVGQQVDVLTAEGRVPLVVAGLAVSPTRGYPVQRPLVYLRPEALRRIAPERDWKALLNVRLADPQASEAFRARAAADVPAAAIVEEQEWQAVRRSVLSNNEFNLVFIRVFSLFALIAVGLVVANATSALVLARFREIGLLKAIGFTPGQVTLLFLLEHLALGLVAGLAGIVVGVLLTPTFLAPVFLRDATGLLPRPAAAPAEIVGLAGVLLGIELVVGLFTLLPAWRGGRIGVVQAIKFGPAPVGRHPSRLVALARRLRMPPAIVLGLKDAFSRPGRAVLTIAGLVLTFTTVTVALSLEATLQTALADPLAYGPPGAMLVRRGFRSDADVRRILAAEPDVRDYLSYLGQPGWAADQLVGLDTAAIATPPDHLRLAIPEGRLFAAPGEAVATQLALRLLNVRVGDELHLVVQDRPMTVRIVGRYAGMLDNSAVVLFDMGTFRQQVDPAAEPVDYALVLAPGASLTAVRAELLRASDDQLGVFIPSLSVRGFGWIRAMLAALITSLLAIGLINILNTTLLGVQERVRELGVLKAVGLTPRQIMLGVAAGMSVQALLAMLLSIPLGIGVLTVLWGYAFQQVGGDSAIGLPLNWLWLALLLPGAFLLALVGSALPARHAGRVPVVEALRYE